MQPLENKEELFIILLIHLGFEISPCFCIMKKDERAKLVLLINQTSRNTVSFNAFSLA